AILAQAAPSVRPGRRPPPAPAPLPTAAMARAAVFVALLALLDGDPAEASRIRANATRADTRFTINDQVFVNGAKFGESSGLDSLVGCHEHAGTSEFKVCGCGVKVMPSLLTECQEYKQYSETVGKCDCSLSECDEKVLTSGYSTDFEWKANSFFIAAC
ncbi:unnamed protein product, partial [Prorocentrum cordatum]